jgi:hypothetical protein
MSLKTAVMLAGIAMVLGACGGSGGEQPSGAGTTSPAPLFPDAFKGVCAGAGVDKATAYNKNATSHKALLFQTYDDDLQDQSHLLPPAWTVTFAPKGDALTAIDLVVCAERTKDKLVKTCDGYKDDNKPTGNKVRWHTATYDVTVHEAKTAKQLSKTQLEATDETCPLIASFDSKNQTIDMYDTLKDTALNKVLQPFMAK